MAFIREGHLELLPALIEGVRDVLEEDVLVLGGRIHAGAQLVGGGPKGLLEVLVYSFAPGAPATKMRCSASLT